MSQPEPTMDPATMMMHATVRIYGPLPADAKKVNTGTGFIVGKMLPNSTQAHIVLVTALHVLADIGGETAQVVVRVSPRPGVYERRLFPLRIRSNGKPLWTQHPTADVAVMYVPLAAAAIQPIPSVALAGDDDFREFEFHPGDEVLTVGYPYGVEANTFGFGVMRSGRIASFPLVPAKTLGTFAVDFSVFGGHSGGPVFFNDTSRAIGQVVHMRRVFRILGLVSSQTVVGAEKKQLNVAHIVHAAFIKEAIELLPPAP